MTVVESSLIHCRVYHTQRQKLNSLTLEQRAFVNDANDANGYVNW